MKRDWKWKCQFAALLLAMFILGCVTICLIVGQLWVQAIAVGIVYYLVCEKFHNFTDIP